MNIPVELDADRLLARVAAQIPPALRTNIVVIGSIAAAWAFRDVSGTNSVATKDIDLLLRPDLHAVATAETLGKELLRVGWLPQFPNGTKPGTPATPDNELPALRLSPPPTGHADDGDRETWFIELLAEPPADQQERKHWRRIRTADGEFGLPSFRFMRVAVDGAMETPHGIRVATPARMALAHLLEHATPDTTPISGLPNRPARYVKDVGRAVAMWWLSREQDPLASEEWLRQWGATIDAVLQGHMAATKVDATASIHHLAPQLAAAHAIALNSLLAPHGTSMEAFQRAYAGLIETIESM